MEQVTNEVLAERIDGLKHLVMNELLFIKEQTTKTNGRVTVLEDKVEKNRENLDIRVNSNRDVISKIIGAVIVVNIVIGISVTIVLKFF